MLEQFMTNEYRFDSLTEINDNLQYLDYINNNYEFKQAVVPPVTAYKYQGNFLGLLNEMGVDPSLYLYTMYLNGYQNPVDFEGDRVQFTIPIKPPIPVA